MLLCEVSGKDVDRALADLRAGDPGAFDRLVVLAYEWLGKRVVAALRGYRSVRLPEDEIVHDHVLGRLRTALAGAVPETCEELTRLAERQIRWALRDVVRSQGRRADRVSVEAAADAGEPAWLADPAAGEVVADLIDARDRARFHRAAAELPEPLRQVFCLRFYAGLSEAEVAADLGVSDRTVRTHWRAAVDGISVAVTGRPVAGDLPRLRRDGGAPDPAPCRRCP